MPKLNQQHFSVVFVSQTYSQIKDGLTFDYHVSANKELIRQNPELLPTRLMSWYPKHPEMQYLECIREVMAKGATKGDRTGTGVVSKFGY